MEVMKRAEYDALLSRRAQIAQPAPRFGARVGVATAPRYLFAGGFPDPGSFPLQGLLDATREMLQREGKEAMTYGAPLGYQGLRELVCEKTKHYDGFTISPDNVLITNGSSHALALCADAFVDIGDPVIVEAPTFSGTLGNFRRYGPELIGVPLDGEGIRTDVLEERLQGLERQGRRAKFIYTIVNFQNPAGPTQSLRRRRELLDLAEKYDTLVVEDDAYGELRYEGEPITSLFGLDQNGRVLRTGTLSKILGAGVRLGWAIAPKELIPRLAAFKTDGGTNPYMSRLATTYMREHMYDHVEELKRIYKQKRDLMLDRLRQGLGDHAEISHPEGGFFIWIRLPEGTDPEKLWNLATERGIGYVPGFQFFPDAAGGHDHIRLAFSYAELEDIRVGTDRLVEAIHEAR